MSSIDVEDFNNWVTSISDNYKQSQLKALMKVNGEMLSVFFEIGKEISSTPFKATYVNDFYDNLSKELINRLSNYICLSPVNIRYMEKFYLLYKDKLQIFPQVMERLASISWGHHMCIIDKCKNDDEALFFVNKSIENNWSKDMLSIFLDTNLYEKQE